MFDKLKFWKKEDEFASGDDFEKEFGKDFLNTDENPFDKELSSEPNFDQPQFQDQPDQYQSPQHFQEDNLGSAGSFQNPFEEAQPPQPSQYAQPQTSNSVGRQLAQNYVNSQTKPLDSKPHNPDELLNLKIDSIRSTLENIDLRVRKIENLLEKKRSW
jgi:hypothetical protein